MFYFVVKQFHHRNGTVIGKTVGVVSADNLEDATQKVISEYVSDNSVLEFVEEMDAQKGFSYTVYKSAL